MWSLGCLLYECCALHPPFEASNQLALAMKIKTGRFDRIPACFSDELQRFIRALIEVEQVWHARTRTHTHTHTPTDFCNRRGAWVWSRRWRCGRWRGG